MDADIVATLETTAGHSLVNRKSSLLIHCLRKIRVDSLLSGFAVSSGRKCLKIRFISCFFARCLFVILDCTSDFGFPQTCSYSEIAVAPKWEKSLPDDRDCDIRKHEKRTPLQALPSNVL